jgi:hypothetical protein
VRKLPYVLGAGLVMIGLIVVVLSYVSYQDADRLAAEQAGDDWYVAHLHEQQQTNLIVGPAGGVMVLAGAGLIGLTRRRRAAQGTSADGH